MHLKVIAYLRRNHLALVAIFLATTGSAFAASTALKTGSVDSRAVKDRSLRSVDLKPKAVNSKAIDLASVSQILQARVAAGCKEGEAIRLITRTGKVSCQSVSDGPKAADGPTGVAAGSGLTGGGTSGAVTLAVDSAAVQSRVKDGCGDAQALKAIKQDGSVVCQDFGSGNGSVTSVGVDDTGLTSTENPITTFGTLGIDFAKVQGRVSGTCTSTTAIQTVGSDGAVTCSDSLQRRVTGSCSSTTAVQSVAADGTATCSDSLQNRVTGTCTTTGNTGVQGVNADGTVSCGNLQNRVTGDCSGNTALQSITAAGAANCSNAFLSAGRVLTSGLVEIAAGAPPTTLISNAYFEVTATCPSGMASLQVHATTGLNVLVQDQVNGFHAIGTVQSDVMTTVAGASQGTFSFGGTTGSAAGHTLQGTYYLFPGSSACQFGISGMADA